MADYRFQLAQIFLELGNTGGKDFLRPGCQALEQGEKNATEYQEEAGRGTKYEQPVVPIQYGEKGDGEQRADTETKNHSLCHEKQIDGTQLLLLDFVSEKFKPSLTARQQRNSDVFQGGEQPTVLAALAVAHSAVRRLTATDDYADQKTDAGDDADSLPGIFVDVIVGRTSGGLGFVD